MVAIMDKAAAATAATDGARDYRGVLYGGFMRRPRAGRRCVEFNVPGDP